MDINVVAENLVELLTNSVNLTEVYYDLFINPTPMDITLKQYDTDNKLVDVTIPNRAKDRQIALSGSGLPEGNIEAPIGTFYVNTNDSTVYIKTTISGSNGWQLILTEGNVNSYLSNFVPSTRKVNNKMLNKDIILTASDVGALSSTEQYGRFLSASQDGNTLNLEDVNNNVISNISSDAFGVNRSLTNLNPVGEEHFLSKAHIGEGCILEAPNGVLQILDSGETLKVPKGLKVLVADGKTGDRLLNNFEFTVPDDIISSLKDDISFASDLYYVILLTVSQDKQRCQIDYRHMGETDYNRQFYEQATEPNIPTDTHCTWYNSGSNQWFNKGSKTGATSNWAKSYNVKLAFCRISNHKVMSSKMFQPYRAVLYSDRITNFNQVNFNTQKAIPYGTVWSAPEDGRIFVYSTLICEGASTTEKEITGLLGENVSPSSTYTFIHEEFPYQGSFTVNIPVAGYYSVTLVGGGGTGGTAIGSLSSGQTYTNGGSGGSGGAFVGELYFTAGDHTVTVGGPNQSSSIDNILITGNGTAGGGNTGLNAVPYAGTGGTVSITGNAKQGYTEYTGNNGTTFTGNTVDDTLFVQGGSSVYGGYGQGASSNGTPTNGYCSIHGSYLSTSASAKGNVCYKHGLKGSNGDKTTQSGIIDIYKGEQIVFYNSIIPTSNQDRGAWMYFCPTKINTVENI